MCFSFNGFLTEVFLIHRKNIYCHSFFFIQPCITMIFHIRNDAMCVLSKRGLWHFIEKMYGYFLLIDSYEFWRHVMNPANFVIKQHWNIQVSLFLLYYYFCVSFSFGYLYIWVHFQTRDNWSSLIKQGVFAISYHIEDIWCQKFRNNSESILSDVDIIHLCLKPSTIFGTMTPMTTMLKMSRS